MQQKVSETEIDEEASEFTCEICIEPAQTKSKFNNGSKCNHPFCNNCISNYVQVKVQEENTPKIQCPGLDCNHPLDPISCKSIIPNPIFERWCDLLVESAVSGYESCYCPYQNCSVLVLNECSSRNRSVKKTKCPNCKNYFCFQCKIQWHAGYRCSESGQLRDENDILVGELIERNKWTRCYNCGHAVIRVDGCRAVHCRCGVEFCHECGGRLHLGPCAYKCSGACDLLAQVFCGLLCIAVFVLYMHLLVKMSPIKN